MSDEETRRAERRAQDDALAAGRLAVMNSRIDPRIRLIPVVLSAPPEGRVTMTPAEVRGWLLPEHGVILDQPAAFRDTLLPSDTQYPRGTILGVGKFRATVPEWFLDGLG